MAVTTINLVSTSGSISPDGHIDLTANYEVFTSSASDLAYVVLAAVDAYIPATWPDLAYAVPHRIGEATQVAEHKKWNVPVLYSTRPLPGGVGAGFTIKNVYGTDSKIILDEPWRISGTYVGTTRGATKDIDGNPIVTLGTEELKVREVPDGYDTLRLEGASANISLPTRAQAVKKCNSATMWGLTPRQLFLENWAFEIRYYAGTAYIWNALDFWIKYDEWTERFWNASKKKINPDWNPFLDEPEDRLTAILGYDKLPITEPQLIDATGAPCDPDDAVELAYEVIGEFNFLTLGLPPTLPGPFV